MRPSRLAGYRVFTLILGVGVLGCGGPEEDKPTPVIDVRDSLVGTYRGKLATVTYFSDGRNETFTTPFETSVSKLGETQITFGGTCQLTATVDRDGAFTYDRKVCPAETKDSCSVGMSVDAGKGRISAGRLVVNYSGKLNASCSDGSSDSAVFDASLDATRV